MKRNKNLTVLPAIIRSSVPNSTPNTTRNTESPSKQSSNRSIMNMISPRSNEKVSSKPLVKKFELFQEDFDVKPESTSIFAPAYFRIKKSQTTPVVSEITKGAQLSNFLEDLEEILDNIRENFVRASYIGALPTQIDLIFSQNEISHCCIDVFMRLKDISAKNILSPEFVNYYQKQLQPLLKAYQKHRELCLQVIKAHEEMKLLSVSKKDTENRSGPTIDSSSFAKQIKQRILKEQQALGLAVDQYKLQLKLLKSSQIKAKAAGTNSNMKKPWEGLVKRAAEFYESSHQEVENLIVSTYNQLVKLSGDVKTELKALSSYCNRFSRVRSVVLQMVEIQNQKDEIENQLNKLEGLYFSHYVVEIKKSSKSPQLSVLKSLFYTNAASVISEIQSLKNKIHQINNLFEPDTKAENTCKSDGMALITNQYLQFKWKILQDLANLSSRISLSKEYESCIIKLIELSNELEKYPLLRKSFESQIPALQSSRDGNEQLKLEFIEKIYSEIFDPLAKYLMTIQRFLRVDPIINLNYSFERYIFGEIFKCEFIIEQLCSKNHDSLREFYRKWRILVAQENAKFPNFLEQEVDFQQIHKDLTKTTQALIEIEHQSVFEQKFMLMIEKSCEKLLNLSHTVRPLLELFTDKARANTPIDESEEARIQQIYSEILRIKDEAYFDYEIKSIAESQCNFIKDVIAFSSCCRKIRSSLTPEILKQKQIAPELGQHSENLLEAYNNTKKTYNYHSAYSVRIDNMFAKLSQAIESIYEIQAFFTNDDYLIDERVLTGLEILCQKDELPTFTTVSSQLSQVRKVLEHFLETSRVVEEIILLWKKRHLIGLEKLKILIENQFDIGSEIEKIKGLFHGAETRHQLYLTEKAFLEYYVNLQELKVEWHNLCERTDMLVKGSRSVLKEQIDLLDKLGKITDCIREDFSTKKQNKLTDLQMMYLSHLKGLLRSQAIDMKGHLELKAIGKGQLASEAIQILCKQESATKIFGKLTKKLCIRTGPENKAINAPNGFDFCLSGKIIYKMSRSCFICPAVIEIPSLDTKAEEILLISSKEIGFLDKVNEMIVDDEEVDWKIKWRGYRNNLDLGNFIFFLAEI